MDWWIFGGLLGAGLAALALVPLVPALREAYPGMADWSADAKWAYAWRYAVWTASWLIGWEFLHRYALLRAVDARWPRWGWLIAPLFETAYHLQKPLLEAGGMLALGLCLTFWAKRRRNIMLPLLVHGGIEAGLLVVLLLY